MQRTILKLGHPRLRQIAAEVPPSEITGQEVQRLIQDMIDTMRAVNGAGLAAPQIDVGLRICVAEVSSNARYPDMPPLPLRVWINPILEVLTPLPQVTMYEGCLSVPGIRGRVTRKGHLRVTSLDQTGAVQVDELKGALAAVAGHECDHLDGILFVDRAEPLSLCMLEEYERFVSPKERIIVSGCDLALLAE